MHSIVLGDCLEELKRLPDNSVHSLVTDPPAGIAFMGASWDSDKGGRDQWIQWMSEVMKECLRVMKPGAHGFVWALPRTAHWTTTALENAGFEIRDVIVHVQGQGFPKGHDISKHIDKEAGAERETVGHRKSEGGRTTSPNPTNRIRNEEMGDLIAITEPATNEAKRWNGWNTALKPASEHWILIRKPISESTIAKNVLKYGVGGINVDASRVGKKVPDGRWPANFMLSHNPDCVEMGIRKVGSGDITKGSTPRSNVGFKLSESSSDRSNSIPSSSCNI